MRSIFARLNRRYGRKFIGFDRQKLVSSTLANAMVVTAATPPRDMPRPARAARRPRVTIVGAGLGGLMAGYTLAHCCDVTIFEARERVGGRVWSKNKSSGVVEAGGELIGYNHPLWLALARQFRLGLSLFTLDSNFDALDLDMPIYLDGRKISNPFALKTLFEQMEAAFGRMARRARHVHKHAPWLTSDADALDQQSMADWIRGEHCSRLAKLAIKEQFSNDAGQPVERQSLLANFAVVHGGALKGHPAAFFTQTETLRCSEGNQSLAEHLAEEIRKVGGVVHLSTPVVAVDIDKEGVTITPEGAASHLADYVVLAIPPSLWPGGRFAKIKITPQLTPDHYISMGTAVKYLSPVKRRFWIDHGLAPAATSSRFGVTWEGTDNQIAPRGREVELSLFAGSRPAQLAIRQWERGGKTAVDAFYASRIGQVYRGYQDNLSQPPDFIAWPADPWTGAGYSCPAPGEVTRAGPLLNSAFHKRMYFAGEHTCFAYYGYMEGALQSGLKAGTAILRATGRTSRRRSA
ncbi:NAD(P)/FAD-dependent oxidoreductase [Bradyrhizobium sp. CCGUVB14]|uniref:flavin monoamine oxidase family protein n=1 Tax=Bradyrhizobium sp. CCGUVB14 TaxID=2949628 RepID=UPI0020B19C32|nr:NAD(P)/FAD-dependent oxidoreductase [Bradyrhizobium sp. CCGUVB14]MCP3447668.1 FAD-dependent oxidoreductase [Bradyrhizobium sp. CCGUVB14]